MPLLSHWGPRKWIVYSSVTLSCLLLSQVFLSFVFGSIATCLESGRDLSYKCLRDVRSLLLAILIMKDTKLKALRFSVLS